VAKSDGAMDDRWQIDTGREKSSLAYFRKVIIKMRFEVIKAVKMSMLSSEL
jgi:hypothetical protein